MNRVILMGRLTADPQFVQSATASYCKFTIAVDRRSRDKTDFINCIAWRKTAELINKFFSKGKMIAVEGALQINTYTDKDGNKRTSADVNVETVHFCGSRDKNSESQEAQSVSSDNSNISIEYDDLPFD